MGPKMDFSGSIKNLTKILEPKLEVLSLKF
jgi:hypothetical protein